MGIPKFETYLFDLDGTLLDTADLIHNTFSEVYAQYGVSNLSKEKIIALMGYPLNVITEMLLGSGENSLLKEIVLKIGQLQKQRHPDLVKPFPSIKAGLEQLKENGAAMGVVSSRTKESLHMLLEYNQLEHYFDVIVSPFDTTLHKPDPAPINFAINKMSAKSDSAIYVGDTAIDIACGRAAGLKTALVSWTRHEKSEFPQAPDFWLNTLTEL